MTRVSVLARFSAIAAFVAVLLVALGLIDAPTTSKAAAPRQADSWWPTYGGSYANARHVDLNAITPANVQKLQLAWTFNTHVAGEFESTPIAVNGVVYVTTGADNSVFALDAATGRLKWRYTPKVGAAPYIFAVNRGVAVANDRVFLTTLDARIVALDARTGAPVWDTRIGDPHQGLSETAAPLAWAGLVFVGSAGNEFGVRGSYSAYSQRDGKLVWRWWTVSRGWEGHFTTAVHGLALHRNVVRERALVQRAGDAWKHGGGAIWMTPALSSQDATIYLSTGNPAPAFDGDRRPGDNLYTDSIVALNARSGAMRWYYQETPHDVWDFDASSPPVLLDALDRDGRRIPAVGEAGKTGLLYILNRKTGRLIRLSDTFNSRPLRYNPPTPQGEPLDFSGVLGPIAYDGTTHSAFVDAVMQPQLLRTFSTPLHAWSPGSVEWSGGGSEETELGFDALTSIDVDSGRKRWSTRVPSVDFSGVLSTPGLVFLGEQYTGDFRAYDAATGRVVWQTHPSDEVTSAFDLGSRTNQFISAAGRRVVQLWHSVRHVHQPDGADAGINSPAIAYLYKGREYILIGSNVYQKLGRSGGNTLFAFALPE